MTRIVASFALLALLAACGAPPPPVTEPGEAPAQKVYRIEAGDAAAIQFRMLDAINALRAARGAVPLSMSAELNAAAATHARDMSIQNRPWHFGSDGSSPLERVRRVGYRGQLMGENISETYETELETLSAWMNKPDTRDVILDPRARDMGFAWLQEPNGKLWWTLVTGAPAFGAAGPL